MFRHVFGLPAAHQGPISCVDLRCRCPRHNVSVPSSCLITVSVPVLYCLSSPSLHRLTIIRAGPRSAFQSFLSIFNRTFIACSAGTYILFDSYETTQIYS